MRREGTRRKKRRRGEREENGSEEGKKAGRKGGRKKKSCYSLHFPHCVEGSFGFSNHLLSPIR